MEDSSLYDECWATEERTEDDRGRDDGDDDEGGEENAGEEEEETDASGKLMTDTTSRSAPAATTHSRRSSSLTSSLRTSRHSPYAVDVAAAVVALVERIEMWRWSASERSRKGVVASYGRLTCGGTNSVTREEEEDEGREEDEKDDGREAEEASGERRSGHWSPSYRPPLSGVKGRRKGGKIGVRDEGDDAEKSDTNDATEVGRRGAGCR
jgi:hypothetical protein